MVLYWEKEDQERWDRVNNLTDKQLIKEIKKLYDKNDLDANDPDVEPYFEVFFKRNNLSYKLTEAYSMDDQLDFGAHKNELIEAED